MSLYIELWTIRPFAFVKRIEQNDTIVLNNHTIVASAPKDTSSVEFYINQKLVRTESKTPYTINGDTADTANPLQLKPDKYDIRIIAKTSSKTISVDRSIQIGSTQSNSKPDNPKDDPKTNHKKVIYEEDYNSSVVDMLKKGKYWVFIWGVSPATNYSHANVLKRVTINNGVLKQVCFASDGDYSGKNLNPRTELRLEGTKLPFEREYRVEMNMNGIEKQSFNFEFFQIMESYPKAGPVFQLDFVNGKYNARYFDIANGHMWRKPIADFGLKECRWIVEWRQSSDANRCYIIVYLNDKLIWERRRVKNTRQQSGFAWLQYGVYKAGNNNQDMFLEVKDFTIFEIENSLSR